MGNGKKLFVALLCLLLAGLCACGREVEEAAVIVNEIDLYADVIKVYQGYMDSNGTVYYYALYDIDGNGIEELLLALEFWGNAELSTIYTIQDGIAVWQEEFWTDSGDGVWCDASFYTNGIIRLDDNWNSFIRFYRFKNGELKLKAWLMNDQSSIFSILGSKRIQYSSGFSRVITTWKYNRVQKKYEGDGQAVKADELDWKPLAEYGG